VFCGESALHKALKQAACRWLWEQGLRAIAEEVVVHGLGIIDVAAAGRQVRRNPRRAVFEHTPPIDRHHVVFVECKAMRADFLRDQGRQEQFAFALAERRDRFRNHRRRRPRRASPALGKFDTCLIRPHANLHYLLTPPGLIKSNESPRRWGWLVYDGARIRVMRRPIWHEAAEVTWIEGAIGRALTRRVQGCRPAGFGGADTGLSAESILDDSRRSIAK
jgi:hypothetical protein